MKRKLIILVLLGILFLVGCGNDNNFTQKEFCNIKGFQYAGNFYHPDIAVPMGFICFDGNSITDYTLHTDSELSKWNYYSQKTECVCEVIL